MFTEHIQPRFAETDALGHINNAVIPVWMEQARMPLFKIFVPSLSVNDWKLIIAKIEVEYKKELFFGHDVEVRTFVASVGNSSMHLYHEIIQQGELCAVGRAVSIHYDHVEKCSKPIPDSIRVELEKHAIDSRAIGVSG